MVADAKEVRKSAPSSVKKKYGLRVCVFDFFCVCVCVCLCICSSASFRVLASILAVNKWIRGAVMFLAPMARG
jgi:hypothetical protein